jgi:hypothetical protein
MAAWGARRLAHHGPEQRPMPGQLCSLPKRLQGSTHARQPAPAASARPDQAAEGAHLGGGAGPCLGRPARRPAVAAAAPPPADGCRGPADVQQHQAAGSPMVQPSTGRRGGRHHSREPTAVLLGPRASVPFHLHGPHASVPSPPPAWPPRLRPVPSTCMAPTPPSRPLHLHGPHACIPSPPAWPPPSALGW